MGSDQLTDGHGRRIRDLRVSVTDRCNFRCQYCMPADGLPWLDRDEVLRFEELERLVRLFAGLGVESVRLTGGEPLVRRDFPKLVAMLARVDGLRDLSLTTNGYLLERDADALVAAGLRRINISVDSLQRDRFFQITRRDSLPQVLRGIDAAARHPRLRPIKLNAVALRGFTEQEVVP
ncbi:MAG: GTP 3',8-cyclase MoaA, partial [Thermoleophilaceae bacterium]